MKGWWPTVQNLSESVTGHLCFRLLMPVE